MIGDMYPAGAGGWIEVICGVMFSGKSEELIRRLRRAEIAGQRALIVKPRIDDRYDIGHVVSHAGAKMRAVAVARPEEIPGLTDGYDVIGIDEVQFFPPEIVITIDVLVERGSREPFTETISRADRAMYVAKSSGRNQVIPMESPLPA